MEGIEKRISEEYPNGYIPSQTELTFCAVWKSKLETKRELLSKSDNHQEIIIKNIYEIYDDEFDYHASYHILSDHTIKILKEFVNTTDFSVDQLNKNIEVLSNLNSFLRKRFDDTFNN